MPQPASIEADEYSRWDDDDFASDGDPATIGTGDSPVADLAPFERTAGPEARGDRLDKWLAGWLTDYSRSRLQQWIGDGHVRVNGRIATVRQALWERDRVRVEPQRSAEESAFAPEDVALDIVFEDDALIVIDKRAGLVVHPASGNWSGTVLNGLLRHAPELAGVPRAGIVHRLDKDTSGLMVVARTLPVQTDLVRQLQARTVGRTYVALVHGTPPPSGRVALAIGRDPRDRTRMAAFPDEPKGSRSAAIAAKPAATRFETLASVALANGKSVSLIVCRLETGRTHQIRVHMQALGHPLVGDAVYGGARPGIAFGRQALHAWRLRLLHPVTRVAAQWTAALPADLAALATGLGFDADASMRDHVAGDPEEEPTR